MSQHRPFLSFPGLKKYLHLFYFILSGCRCSCIQTEGIFKGKSLFLKAGKPPSLDLYKLAFTVYNVLQQIAHVLVLIMPGNGAPPALRYSFYVPVCVRNMKCFSVAVLIFFPHLVEDCVFSATYFFLFSNCTCET